MILSSSSSVSGPLGLISCSTLPSYPQVISSSACSHCPGRANLFCELSPDHSMWRCLFCNNWTHTQASFDHANEFSFSSYEVHTTPPPSHSTTTITNTRVNNNNCSNHHAILVIDETMPSHELIKLRDELQLVLATLPDDFYLGVISFSNCVRIFELESSQQLCSCEVFSGTRSLTKEDFRQLAKHEKEAHQASFVSPLYGCREVVFKILTLLASRWNPANCDRCLGPALEFASSLIKIHDAPKHSVVVNLFGRPTKGPGSWRLPGSCVEESHALLAQDHALACAYFHALEISNVHLFAVGPSEYFGLPALLSLTQYVFFDSLACGATLHTALTFEPLLQLPTIDVMLSSSLIPIHICGAPPTVLGQQLHFSHTEPLTVFLQAEKSSSPLYIQWIMQTSDGRDRVGTEEITALVNGSANMACCAVLIAKRALAIVSATHKILDGQHHVENELYNLSRTLSPKQFDDLSLLLFHFYRGPLMGGAGMQYGKEEEMLNRERFCNQTHLHQALLLMCPKLWGFPRSASENPVDMPLSTLCLESDACLVLDSWTHIWIWSGTDANEDQRKRALQFSRQLLPDRYPSPTVQLVDETSSQATWVRTRLSPEHKSAMVDGGNMNRPLMGKLWNLPSEDLTYAKFVHHVLLGSNNHSKQ